jgi:hypothetical protein
MTMKYLKILSVFILLTAFSHKASASLTDTILVKSGDPYLEMKGKVLEFKGEISITDQKPLDSAIVTVKDEFGKDLLKRISDSKGRVPAFRLPLGKKFMIHITKDGFVNKIISVDSRVMGAEQKKEYNFYFDIDIFEKVEGLDVSILNKPVAKVAYKVRDKDFSYDTGYTSKVNAGLKKMYQDYYILIEEEKKKK